MFLKMLKHRIEVNGFDWFLDVAKGVGITHHNERFTGGW